ncbi:Transposase, Mutator family [Corynebacterium aquatimens]|nr:Transposase, Mutator family [Corynebacterium aquatimens]
MRFNLQSRRRVRNNDCCAPKKHGDAERVADISRRLMENPETAKLIQELGESTADANELVRGLLQATINSGLSAEMDAHLGYVNGDRAAKEAAGQANSRNGSYPKTVDSAYGPVDISVPVLSSRFASERYHHE